MSYLGREIVSRDDAVGKHCCALYSSEEERITVTSNYVLYGLQNNHKFAYLYHEKTLETVIQQLEKHGVTNIAQYISSGFYCQLTI